MPRSSNPSEIGKLFIKDAQQSILQKHQLEQNQSMLEGINQL